MVNYNRLKNRAKEMGIKYSFLCEKIGVYSTYISDLKNKNLDIPDERLKIIADLLNTTVEYLKDETDQKEKPSGDNTERLSDMHREIIERLSTLSPEKLREAESYIDFLLAQQEKDVK